LFRQLPSAPDPASWIAAGLGISTSEVRTQLLAIASHVEKITVASTGPGDFALGCVGGPALFSRGDDQLTYLLSGRNPDAYITSWSPDGRRLSAYLSRQEVIIDLTAHTLAWLPESPEGRMSWVQAWVSDTVAAYLRWPALNETWDLSDIKLRFHDFAEPERDMPEIAGVHQYALSPDGSRAAVVVMTDATPNGFVYLMPALDDSVTPLSEGLNPAWSPDSRTLAYTLYEGASSSLVLTEPATRATRVLLHSQDIGQNVNDLNRVTWSPTGRQIAFAAYRFASVRTHWWLGTINSDGSGLMVMAESDHGSPTSIGFSADGRYMAASVQNGDGEASGTADLTIYSADGALLMRAPFSGGTLSFAWSPSGHELVVVSEQGVFLIAEPGAPDSQPEKLLGTRCYNVLWNPAP
jgi:hypothetical protein